MQEKQFIQKGARKVRLDEKLEEELEGAGYSRSEIVRTPTSTKIVIHAEKPGLVIGRGGSRIRELTETLENEFDFENPQIEVNEIENPDSDAEIVAKSIASWLEKGGHAKRVGYTYIRRMKEAGVIGAEIEVTGKLSGNRGRTEKFSFGYVKRCGNTSKDNVESAYTLARTQPGAIGVKVRIMKELPEFKHRDVDVGTEILHQTQEPEEQSKSEKTKAERIAQILVEAENMTSAELERAIEDQQVEANDISKDELRDAFEDFDPEEYQQENEEEDEDEEHDDESKADEEAPEPDAENADESEGDQAELEDIVQDTISNAKDRIDDLEDPDYEKILELEEDNKDRKTLKQWLQTRVEN